MSESLEEHRHSQRNKGAIADTYQRNKGAIANKKETALAVLKDHGYHYRGSGLTASAGGRYVATTKRPQRIEATSKCPHVAALVFNLLSDSDEHKLKFKDLQLRFGLEQVELESQAQLLYDKSTKKMRAKAAKKARK
jgi:hypothetical protein